MSAVVTIILERTAPVRSQVAAWWEGLAPRERLLVGTLGVVAAVALLVSVIAPLRAARQEAQTAIRVHEALQIGLRAGGGGGVQRAGDPVAVLSASAPQFGLTLSEVAAEGGGARAALAEARFEDVLRWIADVERSSALRIASIDVQRGGAPGLVVARLVFAS